MRILSIAIILAGAAAAGTAGAAQPEANALRGTLQSMVTGKPVDPDQGDEHAAAIAIQKVCNHDNPSSENSAICTPASPD
jgi:hypothetical protein